jgi:hypothetical protein
MDMLLRLIIRPRLRGSPHPEAYRFRMEMARGVFVGSRYGRRLGRKPQKQTIQQIK